MSTAPRADAEIPSHIAAHLVRSAPGLAWLRLEESVVRDVGGAVHAQGLGHVTVGAVLPDDLPWGPLVESDLPVAVRGVPTGESPDAPRADVHAWEDGASVHVLLLDSSATADVLSANMQAGNEDALLRERLAGAERLRRGERRARAEALSTLGYELLERGPDGLFRPAGEPADWLIQLCGWAPGAPRVMETGDPADFLSCFLEDAVEFLDEPAEDGVRVLSSGVWTESNMGDEGGESSFQAHVLGLSSGRGLIAIEALHLRLIEKQTSLQRQRDAQLSYEGLAQEMQVKDVLLHCIVHDLRGPLSNLVGSLSLLQRDDLDPQERDEMIDIGLRQAKRQDEMIRHVLEVFSAEYEALRHFEQDPRTAPDAVAIAAESSSRQRAAFLDRGVDLVVQTPPLPRRVVGRADRLERVLANLLSNALRHAPRGTAVELVVEDVADERVQFSVLDRGPGVPEELRDRLFRRFVQGGSRGAAGLGLFYVRMTVERWGGAVEYEPREGGGAAFHVTLRRASE